MTLTKIRARVAGSFLSLLVLAWQVLVPLSVSAGAGHSNGNNQNKVKICHATSAVNHPYVTIEVSESSVDGIAGNSGQQADHYDEHSGPVFDATMQQGDSWGDIIPPVPPYHNGLNWATVGQTLLANDCKMPKGSITVVKDAQPDSMNDFDFNINQQGPGLYDDFQLEDDGDNNDGQKNTETFTDLIVGDYVITESPIPGWELSDISCIGGTGATVDKANGNVTVHLRWGEHVTCTFGNQQHGTLRVYKHTIPSGDSTQFPITATTSDGTVFGNATRSIADGEYEEFAVSQGTYRVIESIPDGWAQTKNSCWDVVVSADNLHPVCHIENTLRAKLNIAKDASPDSEQDFTFTSAKLGTFTLDDDTNHVLANNKQFTLLPAGTYTITEQQLAGWELSSITCEGNSSYTADTVTGTLTITLQPGDNILCTFKNAMVDVTPGNYQPPVVAGQNTTTGAGSGFVPQVLGASATTTNPAQLAKTGASITQHILISLIIVSILGVVHFLQRQRKDYVR